MKSFSRAIISRFEGVCDGPADASSLCVVGADGQPTGRPRFQRLVAYLVYRDVLARSSVDQRLLNSQRLTNCSMIITDAVLAERGGPGVAGRGGSEGRRRRGALSVAWRGAAGRDGAAVVDGRAARRPQKKIESSANNHPVGWRRGLALAGQRAGWGRRRASKTARRCGERAGR